MVVQHVPDRRMDATGSILAKGRREMTGDEARDFVEELTKWDCEVSGRVFEEFIEEAKKLLDSSRISRPKPISAPPLSEHGAWVSNRRPRSACSCLYQTVPLIYGDTAMTIRKSTSERLTAWIQKLNLYDEFLATVSDELEVGNFRTQEEYQELAIEFLKKHFRPSVLDTAIADFTYFTSLKPESQTYTTTGEKPEPISAPPITENEAKKAERLRKWMLTFCGASSVAKGNDEEKPVMHCSVCGSSEPHDCTKCKPTDPWGAPTDTRGYPEK